MSATPHNPEEIIAEVDEKDEVVGTMLRKEHGTGRLHREASIFITNKNGEILVQRRTDSGLLDYSASGHFSVNEDYRKGAVREIFEELGIEVKPEKLRKITKKGNFVNNRFVTLFELQVDNLLSDFKIDRSEVELIRYYSVGELKNILAHQPKTMTEGFREALRMYFHAKKVE